MKILLHVESKKLTYQPELPTLPEISELPEATLSVFLMCIVWIKLGLELNVLQ